MHVVVVIPNVYGLPQQQWIEGEVGTYLGRPGELEP